MKDFKVIKNRLTIKETISFIGEVVSSYFDVDEDTGEKTYEPYLGNLALKNAFLKYYTDFEFSDDVEENYEVIGTLDIDDYDYTSKVSNIQFKEMKDAITKEVEYGKELLMKEQTDELAKFLKVLTKKVSEFKVPKINASQLNKAIKKFNESENFVEDIVKEYLKSDVHSEKDKELIDTQAERIKVLEAAETSKVAKQAFDEAVKMLQNNKDKILEFPIKE